MTKSPECTVRRCQTAEIVHWEALTERVRGHELESPELTWTCPWQFVCNPGALTIEWEQRQETRHRLLQSSQPAHTVSGRVLSSYSSSPGTTIYPLVQPARLTGSKIETAPSTLKNQCFVQLKKTRVRAKWCLPVTLTFSPTGCEVSDANTGVLIFIVFTSLLCLFLP